MATSRDSVHIRVCAPVGADPRAALARTRRAGRRSVGSTRAASRLPEAVRTRRSEAGPAQYRPVSLTYYILHLILHTGIRYWVLSIQMYYIILFILFLYKNNYYLIRYVDVKLCLPHFLKANRLPMA